MVDKNQANFRIDSELWQSFREKATANGSNATAELNRFIQLYVDGEIPLADFRPNAPESLDKRIGESIQAAVVPLEAELALIKKRIALIERGQSERAVTVEAGKKYGENHPKDVVVNSPQSMNASTESIASVTVAAVAIPEPPAPTPGKRVEITRQEFAARLGAMKIAVKPADITNWLRKGRTIPANTEPGKTIRAKGFDIENQKIYYTEGA